MIDTDVSHHREERRRSREWRLLPLLAVPLACCALPAIIASVAAIGALAWALSLGAAAAVATVTTVVFIARRRSSTGCASDHPQSAHLEQR